MKHYAPNRCEPNRGGGEGHKYYLFMPETWCIYHIFFSGEQHSHPHSLWAARLDACLAVLYAARLPPVLKN